MVSRIGVKIVAAAGAGALLLALGGDAYAYRAGGGRSFGYAGRSSPRAGFHRGPQRSLHQSRPHLAPHQPTHGWRRAFRVPPAGHRSFTVRGGRYVYYGGRYFLNTTTGLRPVTAPLGATLNTLPVGYVKVKARSRSYFYHHGTFYRHDPGPRKYVVVDPPVGAKVPTIPPGYTTVYIDSFKYYKLGDVHYRSSYRSGDLEFEVVAVD